MTTPGPTLVYKCPSCKGAFTRRTIGSGNTFGARVRSDGRLFAPMLPSTPPIVACPHCNDAIGIFELEPVAKFRTYFPGSFLASMKGEERDAEELREESEHQKLADQYADTPAYSMASATHFFDYLESHTLQPKVELSLRKHALWTHNDEMFPETIPARFRSRMEHLKDGNSEDRHVIASKQNERVTQNLEALLNSLDDANEDNTLIKADLMRQLGRFRAALDLLNRDFDNGAAAEQITRHAEQNESAPFLLASQDDQHDYEFAWKTRRYSPEEVAVPFEQLDPPLFKISNREWYVKVLGMLSHNWALIETNADRTATAYFFQDHTPNERPAVIDSITFSEKIVAWGELRHNGFTLLKETPGPWVGCEPKGYFYDDRPKNGKGIYSSGEYWKDYSDDEI